VCTRSWLHLCFGNYCKRSVVKEHYTVHKANEGSGQAKSILNAHGQFHVSNCVRHSLHVLLLNVVVTIADGLHKELFTCVQNSTQLTVNSSSNSAVMNTDCTAATSILALLLSSVLLQVIVCASTDQ
jgi:hypothetical protein